MFRLAPHTTSGRRALVERLGADATDPEQWEAALIEALLTDPAAADLRRLELHLTDFHHSARRAARALATQRRERLTSLYFGHDFTYLYEHSTTSTGAAIDPLSRLHEGFTDDSRNGLWDALPALRELTAEGGLLFDEIDGDALTSLTELRLRGAVLADGDLGTLEALAGSPILPQLESLKIKSLQIQEHETDGDPLEALTRRAPTFTHLALSIAGEINVEGAARVLSLQTC
ncbi:hypothetical protein [Nonomuraea sp. NPDC003201]